jgi:hypothetical protein
VPEFLILEILENKELYLIKPQWLPKISNCACGWLDGSHILLFSWIAPVFKFGCLQIMLCSVFIGFLKFSAY